MAYDSSENLCWKSTYLLRRSDFGQIGGLLGLVSLYIDLHVFFNCSRGCTKAPTQENEVFDGWPHIAYKSYQHNPT